MHALCVSGWVLEWRVPVSALGFGINHELAVTQNTPWV